MTQLLIQPSAGTRAQEHYRDTILNPVLFSGHSGSLNEQTLQTLKTLFPDGSCAMWGLVPGSNDANRNKWERIEIGDAVVFTGKKKIFATGQVAIKFHNPELALNLWGIDDDGQTWEYMYALTNITETDIPYETFNAVIGDNRGFAIDLLVCGIHGRYLFCGPHYRVADDMGKGDFSTAATGQMVIDDNSVID